MYRNKYYMYVLLPTWEIQCISVMDYFYGKKEVEESSIILEFIRFLLIPHIQSGLLLKT